MTIEFGALNKFPVALLREADDPTIALIGEDDVYQLRCVLATAVATAVATANKLKGVVIENVEDDEEEEKVPEPTESVPAEVPSVSDEAPPQPTQPVQQIQQQPVQQVQQLPFLPTTFVAPIFQAPQAHLRNPNVPAFYMSYQPVR